MNTLLRDNQLKYIDVEGMIVVTNSRCAAEQIKCDTVENVATGGTRIGEFGKVRRRRKLKGIVTRKGRSGRREIVQVRRTIATRHML